MSTVYVQRDGGGAITGVYALPQPGLAEEEIADNAPEVVAYLNPPPPTPAELLDQVRAEAVPTLLTRADVTGWQVRAIVDALATKANDAFEALGAGRPLTADKLLAHIAENPMAGDPVEPSQLVTSDARPSGPTNTLMG